MFLHYTLRLLTVILLAFSLTACGGGGGGNGKPPSGDNPPGGGGDDDDDPPSKNQPPVASISAPESGLELAEIVLSAAGSKDPDDDELTFEWKQTAGSSATIVSGESSAELTITAPKVEVAETLEFEVLVSDGDGIVTKTHAIEITEGKGLLLLGASDDGSQREIYRYHEALGGSARISHGYIQDEGLPEPQFVMSFAVSPDRRYVAYRRLFSDNTYKLMVAGIDGSGEFVVNGNPGHDGSYSVSDFRWAPNDSRLLFRGDLGDIDNQSELYVVKIHADGSIGSRHRVSGELGNDRGVNAAYSWSPDGSRIGFVSDRRNDVQDIDESYSIFITDVDDTGHADSPPVFVPGTASTKGSVSGFLWSPDGSQLAYVGNLSSGSRYDVYLTTMLDDGSFSQRQTVFSVRRSDETVSRLEWSPDGKFLSALGYFEDGDARDQQSLWVAAINGPFVSSRFRGNVSMPTAFEGEVSAYQWSPDSSSIAYLGNLTNPNGSNDIYTAEITSAGSENEQIHSDYGAPDAAALNDFLWSKDGAYLFFRKSGAGETSPTRLHRVTRSVLAAPTFDGYGFGFQSEGTSYFAISPNGAQLAYLRDGDVQHKQELYSLPIASEDPRQDAQKLSPSLNTDPERDLQSLFWAPDGSHIAVFGNPNDGKHGLYVVPAAGGELELVYESESAWPIKPIWFGPPVLEQH